MTEPSAPVIKKPLGIRLVALLSIVRWYNILLTVVAQYLSAYILTKPKPQTFLFLLSDIKLHLIVIASVFSIAGGFIINNFYDFEKDLINRPQTTLFNKWVSKQSNLNFYIVFNIISIVVAFIASFKIGIFFICFIGALWIYSHKLQRITFIKELAASVLSITCFFAILLHFSQFYPFIFIYGAFYMSMVYTREVVKQFINYNGDKALDIQSLPVSLGIDKARSFTAFLMVLTLLGGIGILTYEGLVLRNYYIVLSLGCVVTGIFLISRSRYNLLNNIYKILMVLGILNILWM